MYKIVPFSTSTISNNQTKILRQGVWISLSEVQQELMHKCMRKQIKKLFPMHLARWMWEQHIAYSYTRYILYREYEYAIHTYYMLVFFHEMFTLGCMNKNHSLLGICSDKLQISALILTLNFTSNKRFNSENLGKHFRDFAINIYHSVNPQTFEVWYYFFMYYKDFSDRNILNLMKYIYM